jgi:hypothetical protein
MTIDDMLVAPCNLDFQSISLFINDRYYVKLSPKDFLIEMKDNNCFLPFQYNDVDEWVLG